MLIDHSNEEQFLKSINMLPLPLHENKWNDCSQLFTSLNW